MNIRQLPQQERPREKLLKQGANTLNNAELLAIFLRTGVQGKSAIMLAQEMLTTFGSLKQLLTSSLKEFSQIKGLGDAKFCQLQAALELCRRYLEEKCQNYPHIANKETAYQYLKLQLSHYQQEVFACLFLNNKNCLIQFEILFYGTINHSNVHPREVVKKALSYNAKSVILSHNHPSGDDTMSDADHEVTRVLQEALAVVDIQVLDHIVVG